MSEIVSNTDEKKSKTSERDYDIFKDSLVRYIGFSNEFGEALRKVIPLRYVAFSYVIEIIYFFADAFHKGHKAYNDPNAPDNLHLHVLKKSSHTICWQFFATVVIPPLIINRGVQFSYLITKRLSSNTKALKLIPTFVGLSMIPLMPYTIDPMVDEYMEKYLGRFFD
jgi:fission process protein 1